MMRALPLAPNAGQLAHLQQVEGHAAARAGPPEPAGEEDVVVDLHAVGVQRRGPASLCMVASVQSSLAAEVGAAQSDCAELERAASTLLRRTRDGREPC
jgi:hypothetical protein